MEKTCSTEDSRNDIWQLEFKIKTLKRQQKFIEAERYEYELEILRSEHRSQSYSGTDENDLKNITN
jgi:hypothetical protein